MTKNRLKLLRQKFQQYSVGIYNHNDCSLKDIIPITNNENDVLHGHRMVLVHTIPLQAVTEEWGVVAPTILKGSGFFPLFFRLRIMMLVFYIALVGYGVYSNLTHSFQTSVGQCLESKYPLSWLQTILSVIFAVEECVYLARFEVYSKEVMNFTNHTRWKFRTLESGLIFMFVNSMNCDPDLLLQLATSVFYIGTIINFLEFEPSMAIEFICRSLRAYLKNKNDNRYRLIPQYTVAEDRLSRMWISVFLPVIPPFMNLWWDYFFNSLQLFGSDVTPFIWFIYFFATLQTIVILLKPTLLYKHASHADLFQFNLKIEMTVSLSMFVCKLGIVLTYISLSRY